jgi:polysaccharide deacetylase family protein (PEP-CTERM system associated)
MYQPEKPDAISVDVEDYFHTEAASSAVRFDEWTAMPSRVQASTDQILDIFAKFNARGTFFILGWVADRFPMLVKKIASAGHEIGCHSYQHRAVFRLSREEFFEDTRRAKDVIEQAAQTKIIGYRAPSFSIVAGTEWAYDVLVELGFRYDSSTHPIQHDFYSNPNGERQPHVLPNRLVEIPISTASILGRNLPIGGGAYLRVLPFWYTKFGLRLRDREIQQAPAMFYFHPWEIDAEQPRLALSTKSRIRQYTGLGRMKGKLEKLLSIRKFAPANEVFAPWLSSQS